jgi:NtrC-family two-component system response regulator AlgB
LRFFERRQGRHNLAFSHGCERAIAVYHWPGNLRELRNAVERAVILSPANVIEQADLGLPEIAGGSGLERNATGTRTKISLGDDVSLEEIERDHIARVVAKAASFEAAARTLGIDVTTLQRKRKRYGLA